MIFHAWIDSRRLALPDQGDLTHDLVAAFRVGDDFESLCVELQATSAADTAGRLLYGYVPRLAIEPGGLPLTAIGGIVINLTGPARPNAVELAPTIAPGCYLGGKVEQRTLRDERADALLAEIAAGRASPWLLGWLPLMQGGAEPGTIEAWRREASRELVERDCEVIGVLTLTFASLAGNGDGWTRGLEGWNMNDSAFLEEIREEVRAEGRAEGRAEQARALVLRQGRMKFGRAATKRQQQQLAAIDDLTRLEALADRLLDVSTWHELFAAP